MAEKPSPPFLKKIKKNTPLTAEEARGRLCNLPENNLIELPGRPQVVYEIRDYSGVRNGAEIARGELPFLFKPFEVGQAPPPPPERDVVPRQATIHEYLDWTVTAVPPENEDDLDFSGFRVIVLLSRFRPGWPPPSAYMFEGTKTFNSLGAPKNPLPILLMEGKPVSAATIRCGRGFLEVPFFATREACRGKGYGKCLLDAIEDVARCCGAVRLMLCSTDDPDTRATWKHLGFIETTEEDLGLWGIEPRDLLHMTNTVQMHRNVSPPLQWKSIKIRHDAFVQRSYYIENSPSNCSSANSTGKKRPRPNAHNNTPTNNGHH